MSGCTTGDAAAADVGPAPVERRILDAALRCLARWGVAKTGLDDIAREAAVSRATAYRAFPGGKDTVVAAVVADQIDRFGAELSERLRAEDQLEGLLVVGLTFAARALAGHEALQFLLAHEPDQLLPHISFGRFDEVLATASQLVEPHLTRFLGDEAALRTGEWLTRLVISYAITPSSSYDLTDEADAGRLVRSYVLPGLAGRRPARPSTRVAERRLPEPDRTRW